MHEMDKLNPNNVGPKEKAIDGSVKLRVGIIGTGWIAAEHVKEYKKMPDVEIVAGADLISGKAEAFFKRLEVDGVKLYPDHKSMLDAEKLDAVSVCTYNATHAECTVYALDKGVHVLLEKPMCVTLEEALDIVRAEKRNNKIVSVGFQPRFDANMQMVKKIVESGELGQVYYIRTGGGRRRGIPTPFGTSFIQKDTGVIGALADIGCYSLDMVLNAVGYPKPLTVSGYKLDYFGKNPEYFKAEGKPAHYADIFGVDDFAAAFVRLEGGIKLDFIISWAMHLDTPGDTVILGTKGALRIPSTNDWAGTVGGPMKIYHEVAGVGTETVVPIINKNGPGLFYQKIRSFVEAVKNGGSAPVPTSQILYNQAILDGIVKSSDAEREIEITIPEI
ncbi:MAG: Gfo/Idh/MocA family oxidoreductase [Oscillospiraceae bacterium]|nr:Gfo/Idh/MocA family oxidoreductase [Oscillospiraceae bacterium]